MVCYYPLQGYRARSVEPSGKRRLVFNLKDGYHDMPVTVSCGGCIGCRIEYSRQWAIRCVHEASLHSDNCFITLTYKPEELPYDQSLNVKHFQDFMKRFRKKFSDSIIRYFHCGEYGDLNLRPHYHACIFGFDFPDRVFLKKNFNGDSIYTSNILSDLWGLGFVTVGDVTFESAAYVARYIMKKIKGDDADSHYIRVDPETGEFFTVKPEYTTMSRRPGIAKDWFDKFKDDIYPHDYFHLHGRKQRPPRFYDSQFEILDSDAMSHIKAKRKSNAVVYEHHNTLDRLRIREKVHKSRLNMLKRDL